MTDVSLDIHVITSSSDLSEWDYLIPTVVTLKEGQNNDIDVSTTFNTGTIKQFQDKIDIDFYYGESEQGKLDLNIASRLGNVGTTKQNIINSFRFNTALPYYISTQGEVTFDLLKISDLNVDLDFYYGTKRYKYISLNNELRIRDLKYITYDLYNEVTINDSIDVLAIVPVDLKTNISGAVDSTYVDLNLASSKLLATESDIFSSSLGVDFINTYFNTTNGRAVRAKTDLYSTSVNKLTTNIDSYCTVSSTGLKTNIDILNNKGRLNRFNSDLYASDYGTASIVGCDIALFGLDISDLSLNVGDFTTVSSTLWVDIVDVVIPVNMDNCYFYIDGGPLDVTFSGIDNGYRMFLSVSDDFISRGPFTLTAYAENVLGNGITKDFYLLYGYNYEFVGLADWGANKEVPVLMRASNLGFCPEDSNSAFYFKTKDLEAINLSSVIYPVTYVDMGAKLYPQNKFFFYGRTYTVTVSGVKDFAGNEMPVFSYEFTIENPT